MKFAIYTFEVVEGHEWIFPADDSYFETFNMLEGKVVSDWAPPIMEINDEEKTYSDFPWLGEHVPILRKPAVDALGHVLRNYGQLLPLRGEDVWLFNVTTTLDALDQQRSRIAYFDDGIILNIEQHVFSRNKIGVTEVFRLPMRASLVYVTDRFVDRVRGAGLRGVSFRTIWTSTDS